MDCTMRVALSNIMPVSSPSKMNPNPNNRIPYGFRYSGGVCIPRICATSLNGAAANGDNSSSVVDMHRRRSGLESLFCYDKPIPEERIEKPVGVSIAEKVIGDNFRCTDCQAKGAVLCATCSGSGLYVDSIMESQGIIVKVRCLGCGGTGNIMCSECGGRGHLGQK
ncbi:hypothetical protein HS088_TW23G00479 [Tripterygium wilfordii]|uniref:DnaJ/Hsp40 cysteine-rich domain superfamily protein n=1 Tax=Tripterygium wilfordii TaxID=458696 RepID=A0A7J7BV52_TRIWF|nr:uncharacterized protein LOC119993473 [Tripterygium wilfordii]KAF5725751.1 hypothetical protein HS088_TW23G00479 [Tripterygium wilfordii]